MLPKCFGNQRTETNCVYIKCTTWIPYVKMIQFTSLSQVKKKTNTVPKKKKAEKFKTGYEVQWIAAQLGENYTFLSETVKMLQFFK